MLTSVLKIYWGKRPFRWLMVFISILFMIGGVFNDGFSEWVPAVPFLAVFYYAYPLASSRKVATLLICLAFIAGIQLQDNEAVFRWKYPVIGQEVVLKQEIPLVKYSTGELNYNEFDGEGNNIFITAERLVPGEKFIVENVLVKHADFGTQYVYVLSNKQTTFLVRSRSMVRDVSQRSFCNRVAWEFCNKFKTERDTAVVSPMLRPLHMLTNLMLYPVIPLLFFGLISLLYFWINGALGM